MTGKINFASFALYCLLTIKIGYSQDEHIAAMLDLDYGEGMYESYEETQTQEHRPNVVGHGSRTGSSIDMAESDRGSISTAAKSLQDFSFDIFDAIHSDDDQGQNVVMSPLSIYTALAMLRPGLNGVSLSQVNGALCSDSLSNDDVGSLLDAIFKDDRNYKLKHASRVYIDKRVKLSKTYKADLRRLNVVQARRIDFLRHPKRSRNKMNKYVRNRTKRLIDNLVPESAVNAGTKIYLVNALYLKANWNFVFSTSMTEKRRFYLEDGSSINVPTMQTKFAVCTIVRDDTLQADITVLTLGERLSMILMMPRHPGNFSSFYNGQEHMKTKFARLFNQIWREEDNGERYLEVCSLALPKFRIQFEVDLVSSLTKLGISDVFDANLADLTGMTQRDVGDLYVGDASHKAVLEANEGGIEAAAATSMGIEIRSAGRAPVEVDRPFMFAVRHDETGSILFLGKVTRPE